MSEETLSAKLTFTAVAKDFCTREDLEGRTLDEEIRWLLDENILSVFEPLCGSFDQLQRSSSYGAYLMPGSVYRGDHV